MVTEENVDPEDSLSGALCLEFANTVDRNVDAPSVDHLRGYSDLLAFSRRTGSLPPDRLRSLARAARRRKAEAETVLIGARELREALFRIFEGLGTGSRPRPEDLSLLNRALASTLSHLRVEPSEDGFAWGWDRDRSDLETPLWPIARSAAELLTSPWRERVKECAATSCLWLFLDRTKNRRRRWCDMKVCGNRAKVRAHRQRKKGKP